MSRELCGGLSDCGEECKSGSEEFRLCLKYDFDRFRIFLL